MNHLRPAIVLGLTLWVNTLLPAQQTPELPTPQKEHEWLRKFEGEWTSDSQATGVPGQPPMNGTGTMKSRMLGGFWVVSDIVFTMPGVTMNAVQTIGYDPAKKKYIGTWVDSMVNHQWVYEGTVDETGNILTLEAEGPNFMQGGKTAKFRDVYEFKSKDHIVTTSSMLGADGNWATFMTGNFHRK